MQSKKHNDDFLSTLIRVRQPIIDTTRTDKLVKKLHKSDRHTIRETLNNYTKNPSFALNNQNAIEKPTILNNATKPQSSQLNQNTTNNNQNDALKNKILTLERDRLREANDKLQEENARLQQELSISITLSEISSRSASRSEASSGLTPRNSSRRKPETESTTQSQSSSDSESEEGQSSNPHDCECSIS